MQHHSQLSDIQFQQQFSEATLAPSLFTHEAHLRLAWIHIKQYGEDEACENICEQLQNYTRKVGAEAKFNRTLTIAAIKAVNHFMKRSEATNFEALITEFPRLKNNFKKLMDTHYGFDIFNSSLAKKQYLEPDLVPFD